MEVTLGNNSDMASLGTGAGAVDWNRRWRHVEPRWPPLIGIEGGDMLDLGSRRLQSKAAACQTSEVVGSEAATGGGGGVDGSQGRGGIDSNREVAVRCGIRLER
jgi:hypothetical protein